MTALAFAFIAVAVAVAAFTAGFLIGDDTARRRPNAEDLTSIRALRLVQQENGGLSAQTRAAVLDALTHHDRDRRSV